MTTGTMQAKMSLRNRPKKPHHRVQLTIRAKPEWKIWLAKASRKTGQNACEIIDQGLALWAKQHRQEAPPPRK